MIDLHVHSYVSDGTNSPSEIIRMAYDRKIKAIALTDHDSIDGIEEAQIEAKKYKVNFIKGIEFSISYGEDRLLHILGLGIDVTNENFLKAYNKMRITREEGLERVLGILKKQGISIHFEELRKYAVGKYIDRQAITKCFVERKLCSSVPDVWRKYLDPIPYGEGELFQIEEAIDIIKKAGGLSFLAHYHKKIGFDGYTKDETEKHMQYLVALGLDGIERYYPSYSSNHIEYVEYLMSKYNLIPTGGTDFHGNNRPEVTLGKAENNFFVPDSIYENMRSRL